MVDPISTARHAVAQTAAPSPASEPGKFDAALEAAQRAAARDEERANELASIRDKGFSTWVRDMRIEKLKEELRKKVMAEMGLTEKDLSAMSSAMRQVLEEKIKEAVQQKMDEMLTKEQDGKDAKTAAAAPMAPGKDCRDPGKKVPVIAALVQAGGESLF